MQLREGNQLATSRPGAAVREHYPAIDDDCPGSPGKPGDHRTLCVHDLGPQGHVELPLSAELPAPRLGFTDRAKVSSVDPADVAVHRPTLAPAPMFPEHRHAVAEQG